MPFDRVFSTSSGLDIQLIVDEPRRLDGGEEDWSCFYTIRGLESERRKRVVGADGIQAFSLALTYAANDLYFSDLYERGDLSWIGGMSPGDLGLPLADSVRDEVLRMISERRALKPSSSHPQHDERSS